MSAFVTLLLCVNAVC